MDSRVEQHLNALGVPNLLDRISYHYAGFHNDERFFQTIDKILADNARVLIHGDPDLDGAFSVKIVEEAFRKVNFSNYEVYRYRSKSHVLEPEAVGFAIKHHFDYMIILDSSSNDLNNITRLLQFGVTPIILDHHECDFSYESYPSGCVIINTELENRLRGEDFYHLSAGALVFCLISKFLADKGLPFEDLAPFALGTLYSDCIDMSRDLNRGIYYLATELPKASLPRWIRIFMKGGNNLLCRRFFEFTLAPKVNACFRSENLDVVNSFLFDPLNSDALTRVVARMEEVHKNSRHLVNVATDAVERVNLNNLVLANLESAGLPIQANKLYNYTGLIANELSREYNKPAIVYCDSGEGIKASFRDLLSRPYRSIFKQFCDARGHGAAFAIVMSYPELFDFTNFVKNYVDKKFYILGVKKPIEIECNELSPDYSFLQNVALYNEFSGDELPIMTLSKKNDLTCRSYVNKYSGERGYTYTWGNCTLDSSIQLVPGSKIKIKPSLQYKLKLTVFNTNAIL